MKNMIEHVCEPNRLVLTWQSPDLDGVRTRFGVADLYRDGQDAILKYRDDSDVQHASELGYVGYPGFRMRTPQHERALGPFLRRLPPRERSDFSRYLDLFRIRNAQISDFALLGYTEAKLPSDGFALVSELESACVPSEHFLEVAGFRHYPESIRSLRGGEELFLQKEPDNKYDPNAVRVEFEGNVIGYVNRFQAKTFNRWLDNHRMSCWFERRNGTEARPRGFMFVSVSPLH